MSNGSSRYEIISGQIDGSSGGTITGTVTGYDEQFRLEVPAGAFSGTKTLELHVPLGGSDPIYKLFPEETFNEDITVQIAYSKWLDNSVMEDGEDYEWVYRYPSSSNEWTDKSPAADFTADEDNAYTRFDTGHFSEWKPKKK